MSAEDSTQPEATPPSPLQIKYEPLLWQHAEELSQIRTPLEEHLAQLYQDVGVMHTRTLNLHEREELARREDEYWRVDGKIRDIVSQEDRIVQVLEDLSAGTADEAVLQELVPPEPDESEKISKKKQRMLEEAQRLGVDPRELAWDIYNEFGSNPTRLTTGRHQKGITGAFDPANAAGEFFYRTADTHGGKVSHGKRGDFFTTPSGKRIRKV